jgi:hypothetical protein
MTGGTIIKQVGRKFSDYENGVWKRCGVSVGNFFPDVPEFECYDEISEEIAMKLISEM